MKKFVTESKIYSPEDIEEVLRLSLDESMVIKSSKRIEYYNVAASFDIETTSFRIKTESSQLDSEKVAIMYEWTLGINGYVIIGRTWDEFIDVIDIISARLRLFPDRKHLIIYVHNLSFEFQFMCRRFEWCKVFAIDQRKPIYAITTGGIEFRCSYLLSGYALAKLGDELRKYKVEKMVGDLDYSLYRHSKTPLTDKEIKYCENDVRVVMAYIQESIDKDGDILKLPLTKTGYVRKYCRDCCLYEGSHKNNTKKFLNYRKMMNSLTLEPEEYQQAKRAFQGGFTHASVLYSSRLEHDIASYDFTSSYPYVMIAEKFPMSKGIKVELKSKEQFRKFLDMYCCMFDIKFYNIEATEIFENPISVSRCPILKKPVINNGRVVRAKELAMTITEQDFAIYERFYKWEKAEIHNFRVYQKFYLPTDFVKAIVKLYKDKTTLKGVEGKEDEYLMGKSMLNACYGMIVTDICRDENIFVHSWSKDKPDLESEIAKYNKSKRRFLFYPWGVWVTAYARRNLFSGIVEFGTDYVYSDTDSIKVHNHEQHQAYFDWYNKRVEEKLRAACEYHGIPFEDVKPKTIQGEEKLLGVWDFEGVYDNFKTLGAKRYLTETDGKLSMTVAGVNKKKALPYLIETFGKDKVFEQFEDGMFVPAPYSGKMTHTYIDERRVGSLVDYTGIECEYDELSAVHLENADYKMSMAEAYLDYIKGVREHEK